MLRTKHFETSLRFQAHTLRDLRTGHAVDPAALNRVARDLRAVAEGLQAMADHSAARERERRALAFPHSANVALSY